MTTKIIKSLDEEQMISVEVIYEPNVPDAHGEYMSASTIKKACDNFNENLEKGNIISNLYHSKDDDGKYKVTKAFDVMESYIIPVDCMIGETLIHKGTWLAELQWQDQGYWELRKSESFHSTSIGALGKINKPINETDE